MRACSQDNIPSKYEVRMVAKDTFYSIVRFFTHYTFYCALFHTNQQAPFCYNDYSFRSIIHEKKKGDTEWDFN